MGFYHVAFRIKRRFLLPNHALHDRASFPLVVQSRLLPVQFTRALITMHVVLRIPAIRPPIGPGIPGRGTRSATSTWSASE